MISIRDTEIYTSVLKKFDYSFGNVYVFNEFVVSEINHGVNFSWDEHAKHIVDDVVGYLGTDGQDIVYISNRINSYAVIAADWFKFFKLGYGLKGYFIVSDRPVSRMGVLIENLFFKNKIKHFTSIYEAIDWAKKGVLESA